MVFLNWIEREETALKEALGENVCKRKQDNLNRLRLVLLMQSLINAIKINLRKGQFKV